MGVFSPFEPETEKITSRGPAKLGWRKELLEFAKEFLPGEKWKFSKLHTTENELWLKLREEKALASYAECVNQRKGKLNGVYLVARIEERKTSFQRVVIRGEVERRIAMSIGITACPYSDYGIVIETPSLLITMLLMKEALKILLKES